MNENRKGVPTRRTLTLQNLKSRCTEEGDCWLWDGYTTNNWVPATYIAGERLTVRRAVWQMLGKPAIPAGYVISTTCGNSLCVNPAHLRQTTSGQLLRERNRNGKGEALRIARMTATRRRAADIKLSREKVEHIRSSSATGKELAAQFGVHHSTISKIRTHKSWRGGSAMALIGLGARR